MATQLFKNFPDIQYTLDSGKVITIKEIFSGDVGDDL